jgi:DNA-binding Lrp family transcriptional regulator
MEAYVYLRVSPGAVEQVMNQLASKNGVRRAVTVVGEWDIMALVEGPDLSSIGQIVLSQLHQLEGVQRTYTAPVVPPDRIGIGWGMQATTPVPIGDACFVHVRAQAGAVAGLVERLSESDEISGLAVLGGRYDLIVAIPQPWEIASGIIIEQLHGLPGVESTETLVAIRYEEPEEDRDQFSAWD